MKSKRRLMSIYKKLQKANRTDEVKIAQKILAWVLEEDDLKFEEIVEGIQEPAPRFAADTFQYGVTQTVWTMINPDDTSQIYIADKIPDYTPKRWWIKQEVDAIKEEIIFGEDYLGVSENFEGSEISWTEVPRHFEMYSSLFRYNSEVEKYLSHFYTISQAGRLELNSLERRVFQDHTKCNSQVLKKRLEEELNAEFIYSYQKKGEIIWVMLKK